MTDRIDANILLETCHDIRSKFKTAAALHLSDRTWSFHQTNFDLNMLGNKISKNEDVLQNIVCCWEIVLNSPNSVSPMSKLTHCNSLFQIPHLEYILINFQWVSLFAQNYTLNLTFNKSKNLTYCVMLIIRKCFQNESIKYQFSGSSACTFTTKYIARIKCKCLFVIADTVAHNIDVKVCLYVYVLYVFYLHCHIVI